MSDRAVLLRAAGVAVLLDVAGTGLPCVLHWGADPGPLEDEALDDLVDALAPAVPRSGLDEPWPFPLVPGQPDGWAGRPGLDGHRDGAGAFPRLRLSGSPERSTDADGAQLFACTAADREAGIDVRCELRLEAGGLLRVRHEVTNSGAGPYDLQSLLALLPVPARACELLDLTGRWCRERSPQRQPFHHGTRARESRRGRTGHDATLLMVAGSSGFGWRHGEVWGVHVGWSGDHVHVAERLPEGAGAGGAGVLGGGELLLPGEVRLSSGESYRTPWVVFTWSGDGLDGAAARVHRWLRSRPGHPRRPRPVVFNSWEAVYFDHAQDRLVTLADRAAALGVERFVLDDGWFRHRRDDSAGLGDWFVDEGVWPEGLGPLAEHVRGLGMEFGLWVEPEMVNLDSDLVRAHPDWLLGPAPQRGAPADPARLPRTWRRQAVLDIARRDAYEFLLERLHALVTEIGVAYLKWDHNRDLLEPLHPGPDGRRRPGVHEQTLAAYRLLDELRSRHPQLEIESCASGGARLDLGILERTDRVWASDTNDPLERQAIQRWTGLLLPPELVGTHVGPPLAHTTGRATTLGFRCLTALFGHAGIEWDFTGATAQDQQQLAAWVALHKELRPLLHTGDVVRADHPDPMAWLHGVVSDDRRHAVFAYVRLATSPESAGGRLHLPGCDPELTYDVTTRDETGVAGHASKVGVPWLSRGSARVSGRALAEVGIAAPPLDPGQGVLLELTAR